MQDGDVPSYDDRGGPARLNNGKWNGNRSFRHQYGWSMTDVGQEPDKRTEPWQGSLGDLSWRFKLAKVNPTKGMGRFFKVLPHGYPETGVPRGGAIPRITDSMGGDIDGADYTDGPQGIVYTNKGTYVQPVIARRQASNAAVGRTGFVAGRDIGLSNVGNSFSG